MRKYLIAAAALALGTAAALATDETPPAKTATTSAGEVFVDANGMTLYTFDKDEAGKTNCYEQCAVNWPPFMAADDAEAVDEWTLVDRTDGGKMWAYDGKPLYLWIKDTKPGDVTGDGVGGVWHVAKPD